jgi:adenylate cyclase
LSEVPHRHILLRGTWPQQARLWAGLILMAFAATHFLNHAAGLFGVGAMDRVQTLRFAITRSWPGALVLSTALLVHVGFGLAKLARRRTFRMPGWEAFQLVSGILIPILLLGHIIDTHGAASIAGTADYYRPVLAILWPESALRQSLLLLLVWGHGVVGVNHWLRLAPWYSRAAPVLGAIALLLPALALAGFAVGGREVAAATATPASREALLASHRWPMMASRVVLENIKLWSLGLFALSVAGALAFPVAAYFGRRRVPQVAITYTPSIHVTGPLGATLLEISRLRGLPHTSVCGGRARCSTCRVRIEQGGESLPPPGFAEAVTLGAIGAPPGVRLACQVRPTAPLTATRLVLPPRPAAIRRAAGEDDDAAGSERHLAVLFLDIKGFTTLSERRLPYDVVFLLNRFFAAVGRAIADEGGWIDKYMGDGLLSVFGRDSGLRAGAQAALRAACQIDLALEHLNAELGREGQPPLGVGMGLHAGPMVVGRIGYGEAAAVTVIGAVVNAASRLEGLTRERDCQLVVSRTAATAGGWSAEGFEAVQLMVRGVREPVEVILVGRARDIGEGVGARGTANGGD